jgi:diacylglycerol O-acyltransferase
MPAQATPGEPGIRDSGGVDALLHLFEESYQAAAGLLRLSLHAGLRDLGMGRGLAMPFLHTPEVMKAAPTAHRVMGHCVLPLAEVRELGRERGAKVNDVLLSVLDIALSRYLEERGTPPGGPLVADIPVALHDHGGTGNRITILQVAMGRPHGSAVERFHDVLAATTEMKQEVRSIPDSALMLYSIGLHSLASSIESLGLNGLPMLANTVVSNPAGLTEPVYFNGARVELALPVSVVAHHQVLNITATTYVDELHVTFIALREAVPDVQRLADRTVAALRELEEGLRVPMPAAATVVRSKSGRGTDQRPQAVRRKRRTTAPRRRVS